VTLLREDHPAEPSATPPSVEREAVEQLGTSPKDDPITPFASWSAVPTNVWLGSIMVLALLLRVVNLNAFGFNSDEAVYAGQSASLAGNPLFVHQFPVFRAHPLLLQVLISPLFASGTPDLRGRVVVALIGVATVGVVYLIGRDLYGSRTGLVAALLLAVMPYHVIVTRQLLLDGPAVFFITLSFWLFIRFTTTNRSPWLVCAAGTLGLAVLTKETSGVLLGTMVLFILVSPQIRRPVRAVLMTVAAFVVVSVVFPLTVELAGHGSTGQSYLAWQLTRSSNHSAAFYLTVVPAAIGWAVVVAAAGSLVIRTNRTWRELLLVMWFAVPFLIFEVYPLKGYQYLLPIAPALALLAARGLATWRLPRRWSHLSLASARPIVIVVVLLTLTPALWAAVFPSASAATSLAGEGGVPGGREAGQWVGDHLVPGTELMTIGPSMANIIEYYGHRAAQGLSVSTDPLHRNPAYTPIDNPDRSVRDGQFSYLVWDAYSALRSPYTAHRLQLLVSRYHGVPIHTESASGRALIVIYEVHP
jgi:Dolichyl-phosphate-mannose-protein mannosyltransferase